MKERERERMGVREESILYSMSLYHGRGGFLGEARELVSGEINPRLMRSGAINYVCQECCIPDVFRQILSLCDTCR